jgi:polyisoprenoid-binding protein YceI
MLGGCNFLGFNRNSDSNNDNSNDNVDNKPFEREYEKDQKVEDGNYVLDNTRSSVLWKVRGNDNVMNKGTIMLKSGSAMVTEGVLENAEAMVDMTTLKSEENKIDIENFIKSNTYFNTQSNPEVTIKILELNEIPEDPDDMLNYEVEATVTIKGQTREVSFDAAIIEVADNVMNIKAEVDINMSEFGTAENTASNSVKNSFEMNVDLYFKPEV